MRRVCSVAVFCASFNFVGDRQRGPSRRDAGRRSRRTKLRHGTDFFIDGARQRLQMRLLSGVAGEPKRPPADRYAHLSHLDLFAIAWAHRFPCGYTRAKCPRSPRSPGPESRPPPRSPRRARDFGRARRRVRPPAASGRPASARVPRWRRRDGRRTAAAARPQLPTHRAPRACAPAKAPADQRSFLPSVASPCLRDG